MKALKQRKWFVNRANLISSRLNDKRQKVSSEDWRKCVFILKTRHWLIRKESYTQFPWEAFRLQIEKDLWIYVFRKPAETIHLFCGEAQAKMLFSLLCNWALRSIHQRLKATSKMKKKGLLYSNLKTKK